MKKYILSLSFIFILFSCEDDNGTKPSAEEPKFEPAGFVFLHNSDIVFKVYKDVVDPAYNDTISLDLDSAERTYNVDFLDSNETIIEDPDFLEYHGLVHVVDSSLLDNPVAAGTFIKFDLSLTPLVQGHTTFNLTILESETEDTVYISKYYNLTVHN